MSGLHKNEAQRREWRAVVRGVMRVGETSAGLANSTLPCFP